MFGCSGWEGDYLGGLPISAAGDRLYHTFKNISVEEHIFLYLHVSAIDLECALLVVIVANFEGSIDNSSWKHRSIIASDASQGHLYVPWSLNHEMASTRPLSHKRLIMLTTSSKRLLVARRRMTLLKKARAGIPL